MIAIFSALLLVPPIWAFEYHCGSFEVQPCQVKHEGREREGFTCYDSHDQKCLDRRDWCNIGRRWYKEDSRCNSSENLRLVNCLAVEKTIGNAKYLINMAEVDWTVAEQYCQNREMNLVSFATQLEYDNVVKFVTSVAEYPKELTIHKDLKTTDRLGQRCRPMDVMNLYWTGLYFHRYDRIWRYSDGQKLNESISTKEETIADALQRHNQNLHTGFVMLVDKNYNFVVDKIVDGHRRVDSVSNRAKILCKRSTNRKWNGGLHQRNSGCITGFRCSGKKQMCITGRQFQNSDVCNGIVDCPRDEDESQSYCLAFSASFPDDHRIARFYPFKRSPRVARQICQLNNLTLPSVHSEKDVEFLAHLPLKLAATRKEPDFVLSFQNWRNLSWNMLLGVKGGSENWEDGSQISYLGKKIRKAGSTRDIYMTFSGTLRHPKVAVLLERNVEVFPVCQEKSYQLIVVPSILTVTQNALSNTYADNHCFIISLALMVFVS